MSEETILTKHPTGKAGKRISKKKYDLVKENILSSLGNTELSHSELFDDVNRKLKGKFDGDISWYAETVKLDLEARKVIERIGSKPQKYRLIC